MEDEESGGMECNPMENDPGKMFIGGLHSQTTADALQRYFEQFGEVKESVVMRDSVTKRSRGFGFIRFIEPKSVDQVQNSCPHSIDGKKVDPKRAIPKRPPPSQNQFKKVFVGGLPPDTTAQDLTEYFGAFGKVTEVLLMHDRTTKRLRGFGFVTFESDAAGKHVCETGFHKLKGKSVECKRAQPKEVMMLQVNLAPFPFGRGYHSSLSTAPIGFGLPEWPINPHLYQHLASYTTNYQTTPGFVNMPDHRRAASQYYQDYSSAQAVGAAIRTRTDGIPTSVTTHDGTQEYDQQNAYNPVQLTPYAQSNISVTPASPLSFTQTTSPGPDLGGYLTTSRGGLPDHHLYHNAHHTAASPQGPFGHGMPQITLRH